MECREISKLKAFRDRISRNLEEPRIAQLGGGARWDLILVSSLQLTNAISLECNDHTAV